MSCFAESDNGSIVARYSRMPHYQAYYWQGLAAACRFRVEQGPWWYRVVPSSMAALDFEAVVEQLRLRLGKKRLWNSADLSDFVGCYTWQHEGRKTRFAIDAHDLKDIVAPDVLDWCDIYFKANRWHGHEYPNKVVPIVNGNGFLRHRHLACLQQMRQNSRPDDILFISRVWGGIQHNVRLFETLAKLPCRKRLVAILVEVPGCTETVAAKKRLEEIGVECTYDLVPIRKLWELTARVKIVVLRAGKYLCIPWRMIDLLCMGTCIVTDGDFYPQWPVPLVPGVHYKSAGIKRPADTSSAELEEYEKLATTIMSLLNNGQAQEKLRINSAVYFDEHAAPRRVGEYIVSRLQKL